MTSTFRGLRNPLVVPPAQRTNREVVNLLDCARQRLKVLRLRASFKEAAARDAECSMVLRETAETGNDMINPQR
jgi:hypothetical protein